MGGRGLKQEDCLSEGEGLNRAKNSLARVEGVGGRKRTALGLEQAAGFSQPQVCTLSVFRYSLDNANPFLI